MRTGPAGRQSPLSKEREKTEASQSTVIYERERGGSQSKRTRFTLTTPPSGIISENNYKIHYLVCGAKVARTESSPVVHKTVNKRLFGDFF